MMRWKWLAWMAGISLLAGGVWWWVTEPRRRLVSIVETSSEAKVGRVWVNWEFAPEEIAVEVLKGSKSLTFDNVGDGSSSGPTIVAAVDGALLVGVMLVLGPPRRAMSSIGVVLNGQALRGAEAWPDTLSFVEAVQDFDEVYDALSRLPRCPKFYASSTGNSMYCLSAEEKTAYPSPPEHWLVKEKVKGGNPGTLFR